MVPIGRDFKNERYFKQADNFEKTNKNILCYYNCSLPRKQYLWYGLVRHKIYDLVKNKNFILKENCNIHPRKYDNKINLNYLKNISNSKFMLCPRGCGIDTYRLWDCIYLGCIPIVQKYEGYKQFEDLPILFINDWEEINNFNEKYLNNKWEEMLKKDYNYQKLKTEYWKNKILNSF